MVTSTSARDFASAAVPDFEALAALARFDGDVRQVGEATRLGSDQQDHVEALSWDAFSHCGDAEGDCWIALVLAVERLLRDRERFPPARDSAERIRLGAFVAENADALHPCR